MKFLFVGLGGIGQRHLRNLVQLRGEKDEIYAYRVRRAEFVLDNKLNVVSEGGLEDQYKIKTISNLREAEKLDIDCVFICNPTSLHMDVLLWAAQNNLHIFVEKPISNNDANIDKLSQLIRNNGKITFVGYQNRFHPCIKKAKELISSGSIGRVVMVNAEIGENVTKWHKYEDYRQMYACKEKLGGGVILSQIHEIDYLIYFLGMPKQVYALGGKLSDLEIDVEDVASILLEYEIDGYHVPVSIQEDYLQSPPTRKCRIVGTSGKVEFDLLGSYIAAYDENGKTMYEESFEFERNDMFLEEMGMFLDAVEGKKEDGLITIEEGLKSLKVALAAKQSLQTGKIVEL